MATQRKTQYNRMFSVFLMAITASAAAVKPAVATLDCKLTATHPCSCTGYNVTCDSLGVSDVNFLESYSASVQRLSVAHNDLREMPIDVLRNATNLTKLILSHNKIVRVDATLLVSLSSLEYLDLSHNELHNFYLPGHIFPRLKTLDLMANAIVNIRFDPRHNNDFGEAILSENKLSNISNAFGYNNLESLYLTHNYIGNDLSFLQNMAKIKYLYMGSNSISEITPIVFRTNSVRYLYLNNNRLNDLNILNYTNCQFLWRLDVSGNNITKIPEEAFKNLMILAVLNLANNGITNSSFIKHLPAHLKTLDLSHNKISKVDSHHFENKSELYYVDVSHNELSDVTFSGKIKKLRTFFADHNNISTIGSSTFLVGHGNKSHSSIKTLSLSNNFLSDIKFLFYLTDIVFLNLSSNKLIDIPESVLESLNDLKELDLSYNRIENANFVRKTKFMKLILSGNNIQRFPCNNYVEYVYLDGNNLTDFDLTCDSRLRSIAACGGIIRDKNKGLLIGSNEIILEINNKTIYFESIPSIKTIHEATKMCNVTDELQESIFSSPIAIAIYVVCAALCIFVILCSVSKLCGMYTRRVCNRKKKRLCICDKAESVYIQDSLTIGELRC